MNNKENNKIIAEFMQHPFVKKWNESKYPELNTFPYEKLKYDTSWDWLMPVIEKIREDLGFQFTLTSTGVDWSAKIGEIGAYYYSNPLVCVYVAVSQFIKWHNDKTTQS